MRAVVQRVSSGKVTVAGETTGEIGRGLVVYLGCGKGDTDADADWMLEKILNLRIFENDAGKMDLSVLDVGGALLVVSQFTLFGDVRKGRRPSFESAMGPVEAKTLYETFCEKARTRVTVGTGRFQAEMSITQTNEGPVTIWLESPKRGE
ncbi:MAG: D-tyrosyl-tRNA(Tyr) deacylase [Myxococcales bacterium]|nr:D-tyrosyl-tRNA(Tyr) deacylase [Myxococcales bacterium]